MLTASGVERVVRRLLREGCRRFFVATLAEARELRALAPDAEIGVFEGALASTVGRARRARRAARAEHARAGRALARQGPRAAAPRYRHESARPERRRRRRARGAPGLARRARARLRHDASRVRRRARAPAERRAARALRAHARGSLPPRRTSIGNSAGTLLDAAHRGDLVRPGIALYGGNPFSDRPNPMEAVATLTAPILQLRDDRRAARPSATAPPMSRIRRRGSPSSASAMPTAIRATWATPARRPSMAGACPSSAACRWT